MYRNCCILCYLMTSLMLKALETKIKYAHDLVELIHYLQVERIDALEYLSVPDEISLQDFLHAVNDTDDVLAEFGSFKWPIGSSEWNSTAVFTVEAFQEELRRERDVVFAQEVYSHEVITFYTDFNALFLDSLMQMIKTIKHGHLSKKMVAFKLVIRAKENYSIEFAVSSEYFLHGNLTDDHYAIFVENNALAMEHIDLSKVFYEPLKTIFNQNFEGEDELVSSIAQMEQQVMNKKTEAFSTERFHWWTRQMIDFLNVMQAVETDLKVDIVSKIEEEVVTARGQVSLKKVCASKHGTSCPLIRVIHANSMLIRVIHANSMLSYLPSKNWANKLYENTLALINTRSPCVNTW